jgi:hypothetical protein
MLYTTRAKSQNSLQKDVNVALSKQGLEHVREEHEYKKQCVSNKGIWGVACADNLPIAADEVKSSRTILNMRLKIETNSDRHITALCFVCMPVINRTPLNFALR